MYCKKSVLIHVRRSKNWDSHKNCDSNISLTGASWVIIEKRKEMIIWAEHSSKLTMVPPTQENITILDKNYVQEAPQNMRLPKTITNMPIMWELCNLWKTWTI